MQRGFTLVELAIVLVIIGLLVGGVLVGQDLIKQAEIRAVVTDIRTFNIGAAAFRTKYNGIPGDLLSSDAASYGLTVSATSPGTYGEGDGDGLLTNGVSGSGGSAGVQAGLGGENSLFWRHLSQAQFIPLGSSATGAAIDTSGLTTAALASAALTGLLPQLRIRANGFIHAFGYQGLPYYTIAAWYGAGGTNTGKMIMNPILSGREAQGIDQKLDDGLPATGTAISSLVSTATPGIGNGTGSAPTAADTFCYNSTTAAGVYGTSREDVANSVRCALRIKAGF